MKRIPGTNWLLLLASVVLMLAIVEGILRVFPTLAGQHHERKGFIHTNVGLGACYTSNPDGYFPFDLTQEADRSKLDAILRDKTAEMVAQETPYCIVHGEQQRRRGFHPERRQSIAIVGDSFTYGEGVRDEHSLGALLGNETEYNVHNYGQSGATIHWIFGQVDQALRESNNLETIIYFYNLNDVMLTKDVESRRKYIIDFQNVNWAYLGQPQPGSWAETLSNSQLFRLANNAFRMQQESKLTVDNYLEMYLSDSNRSEFEKTMDMIGKLHSHVEARGLKFIVVIYPLLYKQFNGDYPFAPAHAAFINACQQRSLKCFDGAIAFENINQLRAYTVHPIDYHPNLKANQRMAEYVAELIQDRKVSTP